MQRTQVEDLAQREHRVTKPAAIWKAAELKDLVDDTGQLDPDKVKTAITNAVDTLGLAVTRGGGYVPNEGRNTGTPASSDAWGEFLRTPQH